MSKYKICHYLPVNFLCTSISGDGNLCKTIGEKLKNFGGRGNRVQTLWSNSPCSQRRTNVAVVLGNRRNNLAYWWSPVHDWHSSTPCRHDSMTVFSPSEKQCYTRRRAQVSSPLPSAVFITSNRTRRRCCEDPTTCRRKSLIDHYFTNAYYADDGFSLQINDRSSTTCP